MDTVAVASPIRAYRVANALTLYDLALKFGVNKSTILRWEEGKVPAERIVDIERETGIPRYELRPDLFTPAGVEAAE